MGSISVLLKGNERFVKNVFERNPSVFGSLKESQTPFALWFACCDSRLLPELMTSSLPGSFYTKRNHANTVPVNDIATGAVLEYAIQKLKIKLVVICGHYDCGGVKGVFEERTGNLQLISTFLRPPLHAVEKALAKKKLKVTHEEMVKLVVEANVLSQMKNMQSYSVVKTAVKNGVVIVGLVYAPKSGRLYPGFPELSKHHLLELVEDFLK